MSEIKSLPPEISSAFSANEDVDDNHQRETSEVDREYLRDVEAYFSELKDEWRAELDMVEYADSMRKELAVVADARRCETAQPIDAAMAVGYLASVMSVTNPEIADNRTDNSDLDEMSKKKYEQTRALLLECCHKIFPETNGSFREIQYIVGRIRSSTDSLAALPDIPRESTLAGNEQELIAQLDDRLFTIGSVFGSHSLDSFNARNPEDRLQARKELGVAMEAFYKLLQIRDVLYKGLHTNTFDKATVR